MRFDQVHGAMGKCEPLRDYLAACAGDQEQMTFGQVEQLVGPLPDSAREHRAWWGNDSYRSQSIAWQAAGCTDQRYMRKLLDFKLQADDVLPRQISAKADLLSLDDAPPRAWVNRLLQVCGMLQFVIIRTFTPKHSDL
jgi:hypothetical protein